MIYCVLKDYPEAYWCFYRSRFIYKQRNNEIEFDWSLKLWQYFFGNVELKHQDIVSQNLIALCKGLSYLNRCLAEAILYFNNNIRMIY